MRALVTGASGFIGSTLIEELGTLGFDVQALMRRSSSAANLEGLKYERVEGDLCDFESLKRAVKDVDYVFHLAGTIAAPNREGYFEHNCEGTKRLAQAVAEARPGLTRFVFVSSLAAGGPALRLEPRDESEEDRPVSAYGESKLEAEKGLLAHKDTFPISIVRPPMVYGPKDKATFLIIQTVARNLMPIFRASGQEGHKFYSSIHVRDLVRGIVQAGVAPRDKVPSGEVFYLAGDGVSTYEEICKVIADNLNRDPLKIKIPTFVLKTAAHALTAVGRLTRRTFTLNVDKLNEILPDYWICSNGKAKRMLGFTPEYDMASGMSDAISWYKRQRWI
jgi:nucleoside-diphosphate-sugar epimerase